MSTKNPYSDRTVSTEFIKNDHKMKKKIVRRRWKEKEKETRQMLSWRIKKSSQSEQ